MANSAHIFVSHAPGDLAYAKSLAEALEAAGHSCWHYEKIISGENWGTQVGAALRQAEVMIILLSPAARLAPWVKHDTDFALTHQQFAGRLFAIIVKPTDPQSIPWILQRLHLMEERDPRKAARKILKELSLPVAMVAHA